jgi:hypothetical protein
MRASQAIFLAAVVGVLAAPGAAAPRADADTVKALLQRETTLFNAGSWKALYALYTPSFRAKCKFAAWSAANRQFRKQAGPVTTANVTVRVTGRRALASYVIKAKSGNTLARAKGDVYVKIGGRWLDEETRC